MIRSVRAGVTTSTTYLVCLTQKCVVPACEYISGPRCSCERNIFISRKLAPVSKFCTANLCRVKRWEVPCRLPVLWENKNVLHQLEYTSSKLSYVVMSCKCVLEALLFSHQHNDCSDEVSYESWLFPVECHGSAWNYMTPVFSNFPFFILHPSYNLTLYSQSSWQCH